MILFLLAAWKHGTFPLKLPADLQGYTLACSHPETGKYQLLLPALTGLNININTFLKNGAGRDLSLF
jgi:hypothetical protein